MGGSAQGVAFLLASLVFLPLPREGVAACRVSTGTQEEPATSFRRVFSKECSALEREIPSAEILTALRQERKIHIEGAIIVGDLDLSGPQTISGSISITNSEVRGRVRANTTRFAGDLLFWNTTFHQGGDFRGAHFLENADFRGGIFGKNTQFIQAQFSGPAAFIRVVFMGEADFSGSLFRRASAFGQVRFMGPATFSHATFSDHADFALALFHKQAHFFRSLFSLSADFSRATFTEEAGFSEAVFKGAVSFVHTYFGGDVDFNKSESERPLLFDQIRIRNFDVLLRVLECLLLIDMVSVGWYLSEVREYHRLLLLFRDREFVGTLLVSFGGLTFFFATAFPRMAFTSRRLTLWGGAVFIVTSLFILFFLMVLTRAGRRTHESPGQEHGRQGEDIDEE